MDRFSTLRLSPFAGINLVVQIADARAVSHDGNSWELQLRQMVTQRSGWGSLQHHDEVFRYVMLGMWSADQGLSRLPNTQHSDHSNIDALIAAIQASTPPFPRQDRYELWLLHGRSEQPLALLSSCVDWTARPSIRSPTWQGADNGDLSFVSEVTAKYPNHYRVSPGTPLYPIHALNTVIKHAAYPASAQWFLRAAEGHAEGLDGPHLNPALQGRRLDAAAFPDLLLHSQWDEPAHAELVADFFRWRAPLLLTLPDLSDTRRRELEHLAAQQPLLVSKLYRAYPKICDTARLQATLVEARLRAAA